MQFEKTKYYKALSHFKLEKSFGTYYFTEKFIIAELHEGVHFDWDMAEELIADVIDFYGNNVKLAFISNRINDYSIDPQNWTKLEEKYNILTAGAIITYNTTTYMNASIEKLFAYNSIKRCVSLKEAIEWVSTLKELK